MTEKLRELMAQHTDLIDRLTVNQSQIADRIARDAGVLEQREQQVVQREEACDARERALRERESKLKRQS